MVGASSFLKCNQKLYIICNVMVGRSDYARKNMGYMVNSIEEESIMKKICSIVLVTAMLFSFASCGKKEKESVSSKDTQATQQVDNNGGETTNKPSADALVLLPGKLEIVTLGDSVPVIKGVNVAGNRAGTTEFNSKMPGTDGLRCIFELNEYLEFYLDSSATKIKVFGFKHIEDANQYIENGRLNGAAAHCELEKPENAADCWGSMYFNPDECEPGYYDLLFVSDDSLIVAMMQIKLFSAGELEDKSDDELNALMKSF